MATCASEVIKISKDQLSMAVSHNKDSQWLVGEKVCVTSGRGTDRQHKSPFLIEL